MQETEQTQEQQDTARELAGKIMVYARDELMISMRFLDRALFRMPLIAAGQCGGLWCGRRDDVLQSGVCAACL